MIPSDYVQVIQKLYVAYFGRPADPAGLQFYGELLAAGGAPATSEGFVAARDANPAVRDMLAGFGDSAESQAMFAADSLSARVQKIYQNVLGREPEPGGLAYWTQEISQGRLSLANASFIILQAGEKDTGGDALGVAAKVTAAIAFTNALDTPAEIAAYNGAAAAANARATLSSITKDTPPSAIQASINSSVASLGTTPSGGPSDTTAPTLSITSSASMLQAGQSATVTFTFSEDVGSSFTQSDVIVAGGTLGALTGTGLTRTATFTASAATDLSAGGQVSVKANSYQDIAGNLGQASKGASTLDIGTVFNKVLFVGNSATFARVDPVMGYNTYNATTNPGGVHDLTSPTQGGTFANLTGSNLYEPHDWGGVAGLFDKFADQLGLGYDVSLSTRNAATLKGHYTNSSPAGWDLRGNIASQKWEMVVLQDQTDEPLPSGSGSITFAAGSSTASFVVTPTGDTLKEYDETLALTLASAAGYRVGTTGTVTTTILNDDPTPPVTNPALPTVTLAANPGAVAEDGNANLVYTFTRTGATDTDLTVTFSVFRDGASAPSVQTGAAQDLEFYNATTGAYAASGGTGTSVYRFSSGSGFATSGSTAAPTTTGSVSFTSNTGTIVIKAGSSSASLTIDPRADTTVEADEAVRITLTGTAYNIGTPGAVTGTIVNDDFAAGTDTGLPNVTLGLSSASSLYENAGQSLIYTLTRSGDTSSALTVNFNATGTATYFAGNAGKSDFGIAAGSGATAVSLTTTSGANADIAEFQKYANLIERYIHNGAADSTTVAGTTIAANANADASTDVYLYATWARPDMVAGAWDMITDKTTVTTGPQAGANGGTGNISRSDTQAAAYYLDLEGMTTDLANAYTNLAQVNTAFKGVAPVGQAFLRAVQNGQAIRDPYTETASGGKVNLWHDDNLHASKFGSYLAGLTLFQTLTGLDAQALGAGDKVASDLGIDAATAVALQRVASATAGFDQSLRWSGPGTVKDLGGTNGATVLATAGGFSFADPAQAVHTVSVQTTAGNLGTLTAAVRSDGHTGQVNWTYQVNNMAVDPVLRTGEQRVENFTVLLDDGHGHVSAKLIGVTLIGA